MKSKYLFLVVSLVSIAQCSARTSTSNQPMQRQHGSKDHEFIRARLHELFEKKDVDSLSLQEFHEIRRLLHDLAKFDKHRSERLSEKYIHDFDQCCFEPSEFELREADLELQDLFGNPRPHDNSWKHRVQKYLDFYYDAAYANGCSSDGVDDDGYELPVTKLYKQAVQKYESITGAKHQYKGYRK